MGDAMSVPEHEVRPSAELLECGDDRRSCLEGAESRHVGKSGLRAGRCRRHQLHRPEIKHGYGGVDNSVIGLAYADSGNHPNMREHINRDNERGETKLDLFGFVFIKIPEPHRISIIRERLKQILSRFGSGEGALAKSHSDLDKAEAL